MATYYWVGGDGTWDAVSTANWAVTSGGLPGVSAPNSTDTVIFDSASGTGTCTTASGSACAIATLNSSTLAVTLGANHTMTGAFTLTLGTLSLGSNTLSCNNFSTNNSNVRTVDFGTGNVTLTGLGSNIWGGPASGQTVPLAVTGTPVVNCTYSGAVGTRTLSTGLTTLTGEVNSISFNITAGTDIVATAGNHCVRDLNFTGFSGTFSNNARSVFGNLTLSSGMTLVAGTQVTTFGATSGTKTVTTNGNSTIDFPLTFNGVGGSWQLQDNLTTGATRTVTLTNGTLDLNNQTLSTGIFSSNNSNVRSIAFGTGNITLTGNAATVWTTSTATNLTITGTPIVNATYAGSTGTRTITQGVAGSFESNVSSFNITAGTDSIAGLLSCKNLNFTGFSGVIASNSRFIYGGLNIPSGVTITPSESNWRFLATSGNQQITTNNVVLDFPIIFDGVGGTWSFADALTQGSTRAFTITKGTVKLKSGVTSTVGSFVANSSSVKYLQSTTPGSQATISQASGTITVSDLTIQDSNATGGASWTAYADYENVDAGNNDGWDFSLSPPYASYEPPIIIRSFTQPRRF